MAVWCLTYKGGNDALPSNFSRSRGPYAHVASDCVIYTFLNILNNKYYFIDWPGQQIFLFV